MLINGVEYGSDFTNGSWNWYEEGSQITYNICADIGDCLYIEAVANGCCPAECSWTILDTYGNLLNSGSGNSTSSYAVGDSCPNGCTNETACNYNALAVVDDGSCLLDNNSELEAFGDAEATRL